MSKTLTQHDQEDAIYLYHSLLTLFVKLQFSSDATIEEILRKIKNEARMSHEEEICVLNFIKFIQTQNSED